MTDLGAHNYFLCISATRSSTGLFLSQKKYACELLECSNMVNCNPSRTPVDTDSKLGPEGVAVQDPTLYRSLAEGLQYLTFTRSDLSYVVQQICLYMHDPQEPHFAALKRILRLLYHEGRNVHTRGRKSVPGISSSERENRKKGTTPPSRELHDKELV
nr:ribonuclease H-like domain-containing protein [Tanacetum cinerariifolium]